MLPITLQLHSKLKIFTHSIPTPVESSPLALKADITEHLIEIKYTRMNL